MMATDDLDEQLGQYLARLEHDPDERVLYETGGLRYLPAFEETMKQVRALRGKSALFDAVDLLEPWLELPIGFSRRTTGYSRETGEPDTWAPRLDEPWDGVIWVRSNGPSFDNAVLEAQVMALPITHSFLSRSGKAMFERFVDYGTPPALVVRRLRREEVSDGDRA